MKNCGSFHSYVSLPEGNMDDLQLPSGKLSQFAMENHHAING